MTDISGVACPIEDCEGVPRNHENAEPALNVHTQSGRSWPAPTDVEWPLQVTLTMDSDSWPHWRINPYVWHTGEDLTAVQVGYMAAELNLSALLVNTLNAAIDAEASE